MGDNTKIQWSDATLNVVRGCTKISQGCKHCYAETFAERWRGIPGHPFEQGFDLRLVPEALEQPLRWKRPRLIFIASMGDLFHKDVPADYIRRVFDMMEKAHWHTFQVLTKRADRLAELAPTLPWPPNVWMGVSVEDAAATARVDFLRQVPAAVRFLSCEPLIGPLGDVDLTGIHWVIAGGESGPGARPMHPAWPRALRDRCQAAGVAFFFKQWGAFGPGAVDLGTQLPVVREFDTFERWVSKAHWVNGGTCVDTRGRVLTTGADMAAARDAGAFPVAILHRQAKKDATRILDGREWDEMPPTPARELAPCP